MSTRKISTRSDTIAMFNERETSADYYREDMNIFLEQAKKKSRKLKHKLKMKDMATKALLQKISELEEGLKSKEEEMEDLKSGSKDDDWRTLSQNMIMTLMNKEDVQVFMSKKQELEMKEKQILKHVFELRAFINSKANRLRHNTDDLRKQNQDFEVTLKAKNEEIAKLQSMLDEENESNLELNNLVEAKDAEILEIEQKRQDLERELLAKNAQQKRNENKDELQAQNISQAADLQELRASLNEKDKIISNLTTKIHEEGYLMDELEKWRAARNAEVNELKSDLYTAQQQLQKALRTSARQENQLNKKIKEKQAEVERYSMEMQTMKGQLLEREEAFGLFDALEKTAKEELIKQMRQKLDAQSEKFKIIVEEAEFESKSLNSQLENSPKVHFESDCL